MAKHLVGNELNLSPTIWESQDDVSGDSDRKCYPHR